MISLNKIVKLIFALILVSSFSACTSVKMNPYAGKRQTASSSNTSQLGRNRYYFSDSYQKKLVKSYKRK